mmetsp:Transcript_117561/g.337283  ORF Transcript_117561/g.337283 Transcript_117561/m.337283 type:complete len:231 (-) Transcript_117561:837-1529(-)
MHMQFRRFGGKEQHRAQRPDRRAPPGGAGRIRALVHRAPQASAPRVLDRRPPAAIATGLSGLLPFASCPENRPANGSVTRRLPPPLAGPHPAPVWALGGLARARYRFTSRAPVGQRSRGPPWRISSALPAACGGGRRRVRPGTLRRRAPGPRRRSETTTPRTPATPAASAATCCSNTPRRLRRARARTEACGTRRGRALRCTTRGSGGSRRSGSRATAARGSAPKSGRSP